MPPRPSSVWVRRPRLLTRLSRQVPVVVVVGPRGSGVSSLLREWAGSRHPAPGWIDAPHLPEVLPDTDVLVVDDAHELDAEGWDRLGAWIAADDGRRLRLGARSTAAVPPQWDVDFVRDLAFTSTEIEDYLARRGAAAAAHTVLMTTGGLVDAVRLVAQYGMSRPDQMEAMLARAYRDRALTDLDSILAVPVVLTARVVAEFGESPEVLDRLHRAGEGEWLPDPGTPVFLLSAPARIATAHRDARDPQERQRIRVRVAEILVEEGAWTAALVEAAAVDRLDIVDAALKSVGMPLLWAHGTLVATALQHVPPHRLRRFPVIALALALIYNARRRHRVRALEYVAVALVGMQTAPRGSADRALMRALESVARRLVGVGDGGASVARSAARTLDELADPDRDQLRALLGDLRVHLGISLLYGGDADEARVQFEHASVVGARPATELMALGGVALTLALEGDMPAAQRWIEDAAARRWPDDIVDEYPGSMLRMAQAKAALERGDVEAAVAALDRVWPIIDTIEHWPLLAMLRASADLTAGRPALAREELAALRMRRSSRISGGRPAARLLDAADAGLALAAGDRVGARRLREASDDPLAVRFTVARVALADGDAERALRLVADTRPVTPVDRMSHLVLSALILHRLGRHAEADALRPEIDAVRLAYGVNSPLLPLTSSDRRLLLPPGARDPFSSGSLPETAHPDAAQPRPFVPEPLTARERVVLAQLVRSASLEHAAAELHVSPNTVKSQRRSIYRKLGVSRREDAIAVALAHHLLDDPLGSASGSAPPPGSVEASLGVPPAGPRVEARTRETIAPENTASSDANANRAE